MNEAKTRAVTLARVSSKEQEETGYSLPSQEKFLKDYAEDPKRRFVITKNDVFSISESASGKSQRKKFTEMLEHVKKYNIKIIICEKADRVTRNFKDMVGIDEWLDEDEERQVHLVKDSLILHKNSRSQEKLNWGIRILFAKNYIDNLSEEVLKGQKEKIAQGWLPTKPPLGYKTTGEKGHKIHIIDDIKAPLIREMFELYSTGNHSTLSLVKEMYKKGLRNRTGRTVGKSRLHEMLSDPFYCGNIRWKNVVTKGSQNPIITRQIFEKVQLILGRKLKNPQYRKHLPVFKAKLRCIECEGTITWETQKGHWYGHCNHHRACNQKKWVRQEKVEEQLFPLFDRVAPKNKRVLQWLKEALKEVHTTESTVHTERREEIARSIALADKRMERLYVDKLDGVVDNALYQKVNEDTKKEKAALLEAQEGLNEDQSAYYEAGYAIHELAAEAQAIYESPKATAEEKRLLLSYIFSDMKLEDGITKPNYTFAFEFLSEWIPKLNKNFEPRQKGAKCDILRSPFVMTPTELVGESLEPRNKFRTSKNPFFNVRFGNLDAKSGTLLPG